MGDNTITLSDDSDSDKTYDPSYEENKHLRTPQQLWFNTRARNYDQTQSQNETQSQTQPEAEGTPSPEDKDKDKDIDSPTINRSQRASKCDTSKNARTQA